jgi:hypothetical protein
LLYAAGVHGVHSVVLAEKLLNGIFAAVHDASLTSASD